MESVLPNLKLHKGLTQTDNVSDDTQKIDPIALTGEHIPGQHAVQLLNTQPHAPAPNWLDTDREEVKTSNQYAQEDGWGIEMPEDGSTGGVSSPVPGLKVHTLSSPESARASNASDEGGFSLVLIGVPAACLWWVRSMYPELRHPNRRKRRP